MSMSEILSKKQIYKKRIDRFAVNGGANDRTVSARLITIKKSSDATINGMEVSKVQDDIKTQFTSIMDIAKNYEFINEICNAVNSQVYITIANRRMTVSQALALNTDALKGVYTGILNRLKDDYRDAIDSKEKYDSKVFSDTAINNYLQVTIGATTTDSENNPKVKERLDEYREMNKIDIIDPIGVLDKIRELEAFSEDFFDNISFKLAELNARIMVEFDIDNKKDGYTIINLSEINGAPVNAE